MARNQLGIQRDGKLGFPHGTSKFLVPVSDPSRADKTQPSLGWISVLLGNQGAGEASQTRGVAFLRNLNWLVFTRAYSWRRFRVLY